MTRSEAQRNYWVKHHAEIDAQNDRNNAASAHRDSQRASKSTYNGTTPHTVVCARPGCGITQQSYWPPTHTVCSTYCWMMVNVPIGDRGPWLDALTDRVLPVVTNRADGRAADRGTRQGIRRIKKGA